MRRVLVILMYVPAVLLGLLVVAWVASQFIDMSLGFSFSDDASCSIGFSEPGLRFSIFSFSPIPAFYYLNSFESWQPSMKAFAGELRLVKDDLLPFSISLPFPLLIACIIPLAIGPFTRFRLPLWSYFAWTALIAAELAYYLRA